MNNTFRGTALALAVTLSIQAHGQEIISPSIKSATRFAIVVDSHTFEQAKDELIAYQKSVEADGLGTYIVHKNWNSPDEVKAELYKLYQQKVSPIEGAVFVGNIPVPMIREAQFLTSTFKMPETARWDRSSVASDRFYDDFDLQFDFLKQDEDSSRKHLFYYKLKGEGPQYIQMDIYSGRIKPPVTAHSESSTIQIKKYLQKLVRVRAERNPLNHMVVSTGHGYNSNSTVSWGNELMALRTSFPKLFTNGNSIKFLNYRSATFMKHTLLAELKRQELDLAFMTGHGTATLQLLNGYPDASSPQPSMENVGRYIRSKMRSAKDAKRDLDQTKANFQQSLGLNDKLFNNAFDSTSIKEDSVFNENLDMQTYDLQQIKARVAYLNSCLTGSFHLDNYLAGYYPFSDGNNVVAFANTVGVLQDLYSIQLIGILQHGVRSGFLLKKTAYLETHILGDPTYHFHSENNLNVLFAKQNTTAKDWEKLLKTGDADLQAYALTELYKRLPEKTFSPRLLQLLKDSPYESVRTNAYFLLRSYFNQDFREALLLAATDNYEYLQRKALYDIVEMGDDTYIPLVVSTYLQTQEAKRLQYKLDWSFQFLNQDKVKAELEKQIMATGLYSKDADVYTKLIQKLDYEKSKSERYKRDLLNTEATEKALISEIRTLRAYRHHSVIEVVTDIATDTSKSEAVRISALEALSWFGMSYQKANIVKTYQALSLQYQNQPLGMAARKHLAVLEDTPYRPF